MKLISIGGGHYSCCVFSDSGVEGGGLDGGGAEPSKSSNDRLHPGSPHHKHHHQGTHCYQ